MPLVADRDGHAFIGAALAAGAAGYVAADRGAAEANGGSAIVVADTGAALTALGGAARARLDGPVIGITGSVGKTSVKDLTLSLIHI